MCISTKTKHFLCSSNKTSISRSKPFSLVFLLFMSSCYWMKQYKWNFQCIKSSCRHIGKYLHYLHIIFITNPVLTSPRWSVKEKCTRKKGEERYALTKTRLYTQKNLALFTGCAKIFLMSLKYTDEYPWRKRRKKVSKVMKKTHHKRENIVQWPVKSYML